MQIILFYILSLVAGSFIGWIIRKLFFEKGHISIGKFELISEQHHEIKTQKAVIDQSFLLLKEENYKLTKTNESMSSDFAELQNALTEKNTQYNNLISTLSEVKQEWQSAKKDVQQKCDELNQANEKIFDLKAQVQMKQDKLDTQKEEVDNLGKKFEDTFRVLAQNILEDKTKRFSEEQDKSLKGILEPLEKEIKQFKQDIETKQKQESEERITLREQVINMTNLNQTLSDQANKLTETLRLQVKQQGDWGESIPEAILENSGLQKGLQYFTQQSGRNDEGKMIRPDVVVKYPDERSIVIDSKVSLVHYYNMCNAGEEQEQNLCLKQLICSIKSHIDGLASKNYGDIAQALDLVIMFVPVEPAYIAAMHGDAELWQFAYKRGILLISPANLIATLKLVKDMWRRDSVDKNAQDIADKAGKLYDKLVGFIETFEKVGTQIEKAGDTWTDARKQLTTGKGNLISQAIKMNALNVNSKKELPEELVNQAILNDHFGITEGPIDGVILYE